jgi:hypothetical protein
MSRDLDQSRSSLRVRAVELLGQDLGATIGGLQLIRRGAPWLERLCEPATVGEERSTSRSIYPVKTPEQ